MPAPLGDTLWDLDASGGGGEGWVNGVGPQGTSGRISVDLSVIFSTMVEV